MRQAITCFINVYMLAIYHHWVILCLLSATPVAVAEEVLTTMQEDRRYILDIWAWNIFLIFLEKFT